MNKNSRIRPHALTVTMVAFALLLIGAQIRTASASSGSNRDRLLAQLPTVDGQGATSSGDADSGKSPSTQLAQTQTTSTPTDEQAVIARALERTLVLQGSAVLPSGVFEVQPQFRYDFHVSDALTPVAIGSTTQLATRLRTDIFDPNITLRVGLPYEFQIGVLVPYVYASQEIAVLNSSSTFTKSGSGVGDVQVLVSKQLTHERGWLPDLVATANWKTATGNANFEAGSNRLSVGTGFDAIQGQLTAAKRFDPLVFIGGLAYTFNLSTTSGNNKIEPSNQFEFRVGGVLATSPETAIRGIFDTSFLGETKINGSKIPGSDQVVSFFEVGGAVALSPRFLLDLAFDIGVTPDSPDFRILLSLPIRF